VYVLIINVASCPPGSLIWKIKYLVSCIVRFIHFCIYVYNNIIENFLQTTRFRFNYPRGRHGHILYMYKGKTNLVSNYILVYINRRWYWWTDHYLMFTPGVQTYHSFNYYLTYINTNIYYTWEIFGFVYK
jgi:hypothetical protein